MFPRRFAVIAIMIACIILNLPISARASSPLSGNPDESQAFSAMRCVALADKVACVDADERETALPAGAWRDFEGEFTARTDAKSEALILYHDGVKVRLKPDSEARFGNGSIAVRQGDSWMCFNKRGNQFKIKTPSAVLGIRGTLFRLSVDAAGATRVDLLEGALSVGAGNRNTLLEAGNAALIDAKGRTVRTVPVPASVYGEYERERARLERRLRENNGGVMSLDERFERETGAKAGVKGYR